MNVLLLCGGGGTEHEISLVSSQFIEKNLTELSDFHVTWVEICKDGKWRTRTQQEVELNFNKELIGPGWKLPIHVAIPCIHGFPGETGDIQGLLELLKIPYIGCDSEASKLCFNKVSTKLWFDALQIPNTEFVFLSDLDEGQLNKAKAFQQKWKTVFVKASSQGSSVGVYKVSEGDDLVKAINEAFKFSPNVLIEREVKGRELEVSVYEWKGHIVCTRPGEVICPGGFYSYEEKYSKESQTRTEVVAQEIPEQVAQEMSKLAIKAFQQLHLRHLSRVDFFLENGKVLINEINTFPGMTPISMFPQMQKNHGHDFGVFLGDILRSLA